jgi:hypothetical protein
MEEGRKDEESPAQKQHHSRASKAEFLQVVVLVN